MKSLYVYSGFVPSSIDNIRVVIKELICNIQNYYGVLEDSILFELKVILNELLVNAIKHGNLEDVSKNVKIDAGIDLNDNLFIIIEDEGCGYDYDRICGCIGPFCEDTQQDITESGRGILILKSLCDKVRVNSKGNKTVILKRIMRSNTLTD